MNADLHPDGQRWLDLVNGLLAEDERRAALAHARRCGACAGLLHECAATHERTRARAELRFGRRPTVRRFLPALAAAAGVIVVAGAVFMLAPGRSRLPALPTVLPTPDASILTRGDDASPGTAALGAGLEAYRAGDYARAKSLLAGTTAEGPLEQVRRLYLGNSRLQLGDARGALATLRTVDRALVPEPWRGELEWSLAVALLGTGETAPAESLRKVLAERPDEIGARARAGWNVPRDGR